MRLRTLPVPAPSELAELRIVGGNHGLGVSDSEFANFGVVADTTYSDLREERQIQAFVLIDQLAVAAQSPGMAMLIASSDPAAAQMAVRHLLDQKHPGMQMRSRAN